MEMDPSKLCGEIFEISEVTGYATEGLRDTPPPPALQDQRLFSQSVGTAIRGRDMAAMDLAVEISQHRS